MGELDDNEEWTPAIGWRRAITMILVRLALAVVIILVLWLIGERLGLTTIRTRRGTPGPGLLALMVGITLGYLFSWNLVDRTGIRDKWMVSVVCLAVFLACGLVYCITLPFIAEPRVLHFGYYCGLCGIIAAVTAGYKILRE